MLFPSSPKIRVCSKDTTTIDYTNTDDGYFYVHYSGDKRKLEITMSTSTNQHTFYMISPSMAFPLIFDSDDYTIQVAESDEEKNILCTTQITVSIKNELARYLMPNTYSWYTERSICVNLAHELTRALVSPLSKAMALYRYVVSNIRYSPELAKHAWESNKPYWIPRPDEVLSSRANTSWEYASLLTAFFRSQGIPCKIVVGTAKLPTGQIEKHAWNEISLLHGGYITDNISIPKEVFTPIDASLAVVMKDAGVARWLKNKDNYTARYRA